MEKMTAIGRKKLDFTPKGQTEPVVGVQLFCTHPDSNTDGLKGEKFFINVTSPLYASVAALTFPCDLEVNFNRYGKFESFTVVSADKKSA